MLHEFNLVGVSQSITTIKKVAPHKRNLKQRWEVCDNKLLFFKPMYVHIQHKHTTESYLEKTSVIRHVFSFLA